MLLQQSRSAHILKRLAASATLDAFDFTIYPSDLEFRNADRLCHLWAGDLEDAPLIALYDKLGRRETAHHFDFDVPRQVRT